LSEDISVYVKPLNLILKKINVTTVAGFQFIQGSVHTGFQFIQGSV
jgi:hypothetical protein